MTSKKRRIRLSFVASGEAVTAELLDDEAPGIASHVWDRLPLEGKVIHAMYSGAEVFMMLDNPQPMPAENLVHLPLPGELLFFYDPGSGSVGARKPVAEICFVYGRGVALRQHEGVPTHCSLFGRVPGDWKYDWNDFAKACRRARWEGPQLLRVERAQP
jgi:hypothetical protein